MPRARIARNRSHALARGFIALLLPFVAQPPAGTVLAAQTPSPPQPLPAGPPRAWAEASAANEERIINEDGRAPLRYRVHKTDAKGSTTREVIESREGNVARLIDRNGAPLTAEEDKAERDRLQDILSSPSSFLRREQRDRSARGYAVELVRSMPDAMIWTYTPGQPQRSNAHGPEVVLDFVPNPQFKPPTIVTEGLTGIAGRVWIDQKTRSVARIQGTVIHGVDFGWGGMLARVNQGGTVEFEQLQLTDHRWFYSHLVEHLEIREVLVHTVHENAVVDGSDVHILSGPASYRDAIQALLAIPVPTR